VFHIVLYQPEIPPNTGNIIRLCANTGSHLHVVHPLGFELDDKRLRRAGLDYHEFASMLQHQNLNDCLASMQNQRVFALSTRGLPQEVLDSLPAEQRLRLPMLNGQRSLNLSNTAAIMLYEAWRQMDFPEAQ
jgi:tRNA (cytidine/uridine-2'-O-)-methyltransferase